MKDSDRAGRRAVDRLSTPDIAVPAPSCVGQDGASPPLHHKNSCSLAGGKIATAAASSSVFLEI
jgi:hypothetical protein